MSKLLSTIERSTSPFHASAEAISQLKEAGFTELLMSDNWRLQRGHSYYVCPFGTTVIAFRVNPDFESGDTIKITTSHIDSPCIRIKSSPEHFHKNYMKLNTEVYGGAIFSTWLDRPLSVAGRICLKSNNIESPVVTLIDFKKPLLVIPNLAIHMNRTVNDGAALNAQIDMLPICGTSTQHCDSFFIDAIASELNVDASDILSYELSAYNSQNAQIAGINNDLFIAPRIDNISSMQASITGIIESSRKHGIDIIALFDHEEIGSTSRNGAGSTLLPFTIERIYTELGLSRKDYLRDITKGYLISLDVAHATNPNHPEKSDITSDIGLGEGVAIKTSSKQNYCGDSEMTAILMQLASSHNIPCKINYLRSDVLGGGTVGPIISSQLPMRCADMGIPILAMHSAMETACMSDQNNLELFAKSFYSM